MILHRSSFGVLDQLFINAWWMCFCLRFPPILFAFYTKCLILCLLFCALGVKIVFYQLFQGQANLNQTIFIKTTTCMLCEHSFFLSLRDFYMEYFYIMYHKTDQLRMNLNSNFTLPRNLFLKIQSLNFVSFQSSEPVLNSWLFYNCILI